VRRVQPVQEAVRVLTTVLTIVLPLLVLVVGTATFVFVGRAANGAQRRFVADASHEMRSPLATIQAGLDILVTNRVLPEAAQRQVGRLQAECERLGRLVADLLLLARVDEHGLVLRHPATPAEAASGAPGSAAPGSGLRLSRALTIVLAAHEPGPALGQGCARWPVRPIPPCHTDQCAYRRWGPRRGGAGGGARRCGARAAAHLLHRA